MPSARNRNRSSTSGPWRIAGILVLGVAATLGGLYVFAGVDLPLIGLVHAKTADEVPFGSVKVVLPGRALKAYTQVQLIDLVNPQTKALRYGTYDENLVRSENIISDPVKVIGRVLARDLDGNRAFKESDFLPAGTRASPTAGVAAGQRGLPVDVADVEGLAALKRGDRFDILAVRRPAAAAPTSSDTTIDPAVIAAQAEQKTWDAATRVVVADGRVVEPVPAPAKPGQAVRGSVFIAIAEAEVEPFVRMLGMGDTKLICVSRSSLPGVTASALPEAAPEPAPDVVQEFHGGKSSRTILPSGGSNGDAGAKDPK